MGKTAQKKKHSFWKTTLGEFAEKFGKGSQNPDEDMSPILEVGEPGTWSVIGVRSAHNKQNRQGNKGLEEDHSAPVHEDHVEPEKREKAIGHIETLLEQISRYQNTPVHKYGILALGNALVSSIGNLRFGPEVGVGKIKKDIPVVAVWMHEIRKMVGDLKLVSGKNYPETAVFLADAREPAQIVEENICAVIKIRLEG